MIDVTVDAVIVGRRHRHVDQARVDALAESMAELGLQQPISVWIEPNGDDFDIHLVAGLHRLQAARKLGWADIEAIEVKLDETRRELWEIDENLMRSELTADEKREHLRRRKELWEKAKSDEAAQAEDDSGKSLPTIPRSPGRPKEFAADTAAATGLSKRRINQLLADPKPRAPTKQTVDDRGEPNMAEVAERLAGKYTAGQLQEIIDHLSDVIKRRMECGSR